MSCVKLIGKKAESYFCKFLCMFMIFFLYDRLPLLWFESILLWLLCVCIVLSSFVPQSSK